MAYNGIEIPLYIIGVMRTWVNSPPILEDILMHVLNFE